MKYREKNGVHYVPWWEPNFEHHVILVTSGGFGTHLKTGLDAMKWIQGQYPDLSGDASMSRLDESDKAWYDYDWGVSREGDHEFIFYFKDPKVAAHFKLAWG